MPIMLITRRLRHQLYAHPDTKKRCTQTAFFWNQMLGCHAPAGVMLRILSIAGTGCHGKPSHHLAETLISYNLQLL